MKVNAVNGLTTSTEMESIKCHDITQKCRRIHRVS